MALDGAAGLNAVAQRKQLWLRDVARADALSPAAKYVSAAGGTRVYPDVGEYETAAMMGSNLGIGDARGGLPG